MSAAYHERFAAALAAALPEGFAVHVDRTLTVARFGTASLVHWTPSPADKRQPVRPAEAREWIERAARKLQNDTAVYTPEAKAAAAELLAALRAEDEHDRDVERSIAEHDAYLADTATD